jgi:hypothetical protein
MPISTDLSVSPYFDDFDVAKDFNKILFRPGVAVQARELNQLQTILQKQIERFGDNIFKKGTIIDGCQITFKDAYPYVKLKDNQTDGAPVNVNQLAGYYVRDTANVAPLIAVVETVEDGFEAQSPNLKTLFVRYVNSGYANIGGTETIRSAFVANDNLTVYDPSLPIEDVVVTDGSAGFSNTDSVVILSAIAIQNTTNGKAFSNNFFVNDHINDGTANVQVVAVDTTSNAEAVILRIKPRALDLKAANSDLWTFNLDAQIQSTNASPSDVAKIVGFVGSGARAVHRTNTLDGAINTVTVTSGGSGYYVLPTVSIASVGATTGQIAAATLTPQTDLTTVSIANSSFSPVGSGYAVTIGDGIVYQKGYFSRVAQQTKVVEKYSNTGFTKAVGFDTTENIVTSTQDTSLLDNATGQPNATAPGANRLQMTPVISVKTKAEADDDTEFFSIVEFNNGVPYKQNPRTVYNVIDDEISRRTFEESGNYVIDPFLLTTKSPSTFALESTKFNILIDPGKGYINGKRVETVRYYEQQVDKGIDTFVADNLNVSLDYGSYIRVNQVGGRFDFKAGDIVDLYPAAGNFISGGAWTAAPTSSGLGTALGTARIRSMILETGVPGTASAVYRLYLFDINLATARNFSLIRSVFYNGTRKGIADAILENGQAVLKDSGYDTLLYYAGSPAVKNGNNFAYIYRTTDTANSYQLINAGTISISATAGETFPYTAGATLSPSQETDLLITPVANARSTNTSGTVSCTGNTTLTGVSTTFTTQYEAGDFIIIDPAAGAHARQVARVVNNTVMILTSAGPTVSANTIATFFPANVPISLRGSRSANLNATANTLTISLGTSIVTNTFVDVAYNLRTSNTTPVSKTVNRDRFVRLRLSNNATTNTGPWALGVGDVFRLKGVYRGSNNSFNESTGTDVTEEYYIDHNQNENYYGMSYLYRRNDANTVITTSDFLLVKFDYFTHSGEGLKAAGANSGTYPVNDALDLDSSTSTINTLEIPEVYGTRGDYYDLRDHFDFRPLVAANVAPAVTANSSTPINPQEQSNTNMFSATAKKFPAPSAELTGTVEYYRGRTDLVVIDSNTDFRIFKGTPGTYEAPAAPPGTLTIQEIVIPPYPSLPQNHSAQTVTFMDRSISNEIFADRRINGYTITTPLTRGQISRLQPRGYTMVDIGNLEKRIATLEYYTQFTLLEAMTQKKNIPSSANAALERFKFGFFVDSFDNYNLAERSSPEYSAQIIDGVLTAKVEETNIPIVANTDPTIPAVEYAFISQPGATDDPAVSNVTTTTTQTVSIVQNNRTTNRSDSGNVWEDFFYTFSSTSGGTVEFYINSRDNNIALAVYQSTTPGVFNNPPIITSATASAITAADVFAKNLSGLNSGRKIEHLGVLERKGYGPVGGFIEDQFKMTWTHNPESGFYYRLRVFKGKNHGAQGKSGTFGFKLFYPADVITNTSANTYIFGSQYITPVYNGVVASAPPVAVQKTISQLPPISAGPITQSPAQVFGSDGGSARSGLEMLEFLNTHLF